MNILIACELGGNEIISLERDALAQFGTVQQVLCGLAYFWEGAPHIDIVHLHWPESLFHWSEPDEAGLAQLDHRLKLWRETSKIVVTSHNRFPHYKNTPMFQKLYRLVYSHADAVIHMGHASLEDFDQRYPDLEGITHTIIPHGIYAGMANAMTQKQARARLGLRPEDLVFLSFGRIRDVDELGLLMDAFHQADVAKKRLLVAGRIDVPRRSLRRFLYYLKLRLAKRIRCVSEFISRDDVPCYFNAADIVVIPRIEVLNSGNVIMGFTFGKCVIGPHTGVVGEILDRTENVSYQVGDARSLARAMEEASRTDPAHRGIHNREYALYHWNWEVIGGEHLALFQKLLKQ